MRLMVEVSHGTTGASRITSYLRLVRGRSRVKKAGFLRRLHRPQLNSPRRLNGVSGYLMSHFVRATSLPPSRAFVGTARLPLEAVMAWTYLLIAGLLEIGWSFAMKLSDGFSRPWPTAAMAVGMLGSFALLAAAMRTLPLGTAYAVWTGIGAVGAFAVGISVLGEQLTWTRLAAAGLIVCGLALMKLGGGSKAG